MKRLALMIYAIGASLLASASSADVIYCKVTGETQGFIQGSSVARRFEGWIPVMSLGGGVSSPFDLHTGLPTGQRQHQPLTIIHALDRATPKLFLAAVTNENLTSVECSFINTTMGRSGSQYFQISLDNARIVDMVLAASSVNGVMANGTIKLVYEKITLLDTLGNISAEDYWRPLER
jgi:type VI secretion system secreted protein Hcp